MGDTSGYLANPVKPWFGPTEVPKAGDDALVRRVLDGRVELFAEIVKRHERAVWKIIATCGASGPASESLVQQCFVKAFEHLSQYAGQETFGRWIKTIARNEVKQQLRRDTRESKRLSRYREYLEALHDHEERADEQRSQLEQALAECRKMLAPVSARALQLHYEEGLSLDEVAAALGRTMVATRQLLFRARILLRRCAEGRLAAK